MSLLTDPSSIIPTDPVTLVKLSKTVDFIDNYSPPSSPSTPTTTIRPFERKKSPRPTNDYILWPDKNMAENPEFTPPNLKKLKEAEQLYSTIYEKYKSDPNLGPSHPTTINSRLNYLNAKFYLVFDGGHGNLEEAVQYLEESFQLKKKLKEENCTKNEDSVMREIETEKIHEAVVNRFRAIHQLKQGNIDEAYKLFGMVFKSFHQYLGPEHLQTLDAFKMREILWQKYYSVKIKEEEGKSLKPIIKKKPIIIEERQLKETKGKVELTTVKKEEREIKRIQDEEAGTYLSIKEAHVDVIKELTSRTRMGKERQGQEKPRKNETQAQSTLEVIEHPLSGSPTPSSSSIKSYTFNEGKQEKQFKVNSSLNKYRSEFLNDKKLDEKFVVNLRGKETKEVTKENPTKMTCVNSNFDHEDKMEDVDAENLITINIKIENTENAGLHAIHTNDKSCILM